MFAAASESVALLNLGFKEVRSLEPGEMVLIQDNEVRVARFAELDSESHLGEHVRHTESHLIQRKGRTTPPPIGDSPLPACDVVAASEHSAWSNGEDNGGRRLGQTLANQTA